MHASLGFVTAMLVIYGVGLMVGNWLGGRFADHSVDRTLIVTPAGLALVLATFAAWMPFAAPSVMLIFLLGVASFALVPPLKVRVMTPPPTPQSRIGRQHRRIQPRQCDRRGARR